MDELARLGVLVPPAAPSDRVWGLRPKDRTEEQPDKRKDRHPDRGAAEGQADVAGGAEGDVEVIGYDRSGVKARVSPKLSVSV